MLNLNINMSIKSFLLGILITAYGVVSLQYNYRYTNMFSRSPNIESWFGSMYTFFKLTSILASIIGLMIMFGLGDNLANFLASPFRNSFGG
jgi:steroid 5-alpha reductase family enzyme